jgi:hypothetical protein
MLLANYQNDWQGIHPVQPHTPFLPLMFFYQLAGCINLVALTSMPVCLSLAA